MAIDPPSNGSSALSDGLRLRHLDMRIVCEILDGVMGRLCQLDETVGDDELIEIDHSLGLVKEDLGVSLGGLVQISHVIVVDGDLRLRFELDVGGLLLDLRGVGVEALLAGHHFSILVETFVPVMSEAVDVWGDAVLKSLGVIGCEAELLVVTAGEDDLLRVALGDTVELHERSEEFLVEHSLADGSTVDAGSRRLKETIIREVDHRLLACTEDLSHLSSGEVITDGAGLACVVPQADGVYVRLTVIRQSDFRYALQLALVDPLVDCALIDVHVGCDFRNGHVIRVILDIVQLRHFLSVDLDLTIHDLWSEASVLQHCLDSRRSDVQLYGGLCDVHGSRLHPHVLEVLHVSRWNYDVAVRVLESLQRSIMIPLVDSDVADSEFTSGLRHGVCLFLVGDKVGIVCHDRVVPFKV